MFYPGARVVAHGLKSRSDLNDSCGIVVSRRQRGRWAVQFGCNDQALSVHGKNLALSTTQAEKASCVIIEPLPLSAPFEQVCAGTRPFLRVKLPMHTEAAEVLALQREMGWRDVQGVPAYTEHGTYRDLYVYFDHADVTSPVNELATQAFRMYGLRGAPSIDWVCIRGPAVVVRAEPPCSRYKELIDASGTDLPMLKVDEIVSTLCHFRCRCAHDIARERDLARLIL